MKMLLLVLLLLWNDKEGAHAIQGKKTYCFGMSSCLIIVAEDCNRRNERGGVVVRKKLKLNERDVVTDSFERPVHYSKTDYLLLNSTRDS